MQDVCAFRFEAVGCVHVHSGASGSSWSGADDEEDVVSEKVTASGEPFDGVLECGGHGSVVFGTCDDDGVGLTDGVAEGFGFVRDALCFDVGVEHWDVGEVEEVGFGSFLGSLCKHVFQEFEIPRLLSETTAYSEDFHSVPFGCCVGVGGLYGKDFRRGQRQRAMMGMIRDDGYGEGMELVSYYWRL